MNPDNEQSNNQSDKDGDGNTVFAQPNRGSIDMAIAMFIEYGDGFFKVVE